MGEQVHLIIKRSPCIGECFYIDHNPERLHCVIDKKIKGKYQNPLNPGY